MSKTKEDKPIEIIISTHWPTKIIKTIFIEESGSGSFKDSITLTAKDAKYLYQQLTLLYGEAKELTTPREGDTHE